MFQDLYLSETEIDLIDAVVDKFGDSKKNLSPETSMHVSWLDFMSFCSHGEFSDAISCFEDAKGLF